MYSMVSMISSARETWKTAIHKLLSYTMLRSRVNSINALTQQLNILPKYFELILNL